MWKIRMHSYKKKHNIKNWKFTKIIYSIFFFLLCIALSIVWSSKAEATTICSDSSLKACSYTNGCYPAYPIGTLCEFSQSCSGTTSNSAVYTCVSSGSCGTNCWNYTKNTTSGSCNFCAPPTPTPTNTPTPSPTPANTPTPTPTTPPTPTPTPAGPSTLDSKSASNIVSGEQLIWSLTTGNHTNMVLLVGVSIAYSSGNVASITFNGSSLTQVPGATASCSLSFGCHTEMWYLKNPPVNTTANVVVNVNGGATGIVGGAATFYNVDQTNPFGAVQIGHDNGSAVTSFTASIATTATQVVIDAVSGGGAGAIGWQNDPSQTNIWSNNTNQFGGGSFKSATGTTTNMIWTDASPDYWADVVVPLNEAGTGSSPPAITVCSTDTYRACYYNTGGGSCSAYANGTTCEHLASCTGGEQNNVYTCTGGAWVWTSLTATIQCNFCAAPSPTPTSTPTPIPTPSCNTNGANDANCDANKNIINLNFGIVNATSWVQSVCGDIRVDNNLNDPIPASPSCGGAPVSPYAIISTATCNNTPGILFSGSTNASTVLGLGQSSANPYNWNAGSISYPEHFTPTSTNLIKTSYKYLLSRASTSGLTPITPLDSYCTGGISNCTLTALPHGLYIANGPLNLKGYTFSANSNYVILVNGDLHIQGNLSVPNTSTLTISSSHDIHVDGNVGSLATTTTPNIQGFFSADNSFFADTTGSCSTEQRLNIEGSVVVNAAYLGGSFQNNRNLCAMNASCPAVSFSQNPYFLLNAPALIKYATSLLLEVAPGPIPTNGPTPTPTPTSAPTAIPTLTIAPTATLAFTPTPTVTPKPTNTPTPTPTNTPTPTPTVTPKPTPSPTPSYICANNNNCSYGGCSSSGQICYCYCAHNGAHDKQYQCQGSTWVWQSDTTTLYCPSSNSCNTGCS